MTQELLVLATAVTNTPRGTLVDAQVDTAEELLLFDPANERLLVVMKEHAASFLQEANQMQSMVQRLAAAKEALLDAEERLAQLQAQRFPDLGEVQRVKAQIDKARKQYDAAYKEIDKELGTQGYLTGQGDGKELLELVPLAKRRGQAGKPTEWRGRKWTYVRSDKVKNHWRAYKLSKTADAQQSKSFIRDGKIDTKALKEQFSTVSPKLKAEWGLGGYVFPSLQAWAETLNAKSDDKKPVQFGFGVHLFRYFAGCGATAEWNPKAGRLAGKLNGKAELMIAQAEGNVTGFLPGPQGWAWALPGVKSGKEYHIGVMRLQAELKLTAAAGASVAAELGLEVDYTQLRKPSVKGKGRPKTGNANPSKAVLTELGAEASAGAEAFAGVKAGGELKGALQYLSPESNDQFEPIAAIGPKVEGQFGAGAAAALVIDYDKGKFRIKAKAGLCLGPGAKGEIGLEVDAKRLLKFLEYFAHALLNANYELLQVVADRAYTAATRLQVMLIDQVSHAYDDVYAAWEKFQTDLEREDRRIRLMKRVLANPPELRLCTPEAHGILLYELTRHGTTTKLLPQNTGLNFEWMAERKKAVLQVCRWAQTRRHFENIVQHMHPQGAKGHFPSNYAALLRFMEIGPFDSSYDDDLRRLYDRLPHEPASGYALAENHTPRFMAQAKMGARLEYLALLGRGAGAGTALA